jgi:hypothetical protein
MHEYAADKYLSYKLIESNQVWKAKFFYISNHHPELPKPSGYQSKGKSWWNTEPTMQEGIQLPELLKKIKALQEAGLRAEHMAFSFMKRRVQPLMACDTLGYQYTGNEDTSRKPALKSMMMISLRGWARSSRTCHHIGLAQSPNTPRLNRQTRSVVMDKDPEY